MRYRNGPGGLPGQIGRLTAAGYNPQKMSRSTLGPISVSYTHLDVYKRQVFDCA